MATTYDIGDVVRVASKFTTSTGSTAGADPATVNFAYDTPTSVAATTDQITTPTTIGSASLIHTLTTTPSTGEFYVDITATGKGLYEYRWTSTGTIATSEEAWFSVRARRVT